MSGISKGGKIGLGFGGGCCLILLIIVIWLGYAITKSTGTLTPTPTRTPTPKPVSSPSITPNVIKTEEQKKKEIDFYKLEGFRVVLNTGNIMYSLEPNDSSDFDIAVSRKDLSESYAQQYTLDRTKKNISGVEVNLGYQNDNEKIGLKAYQKLAADFKLDEKPYSVEISNLKDQPAKDQLMKILTDFVTAMSEQTK